MEKPLVSIIITSYNYGHYLTESVESALKQTWQNIEIVVVDDGSTDDTKNVAKNYSVQYFPQKRQGVATAKNNGIKKSRGKFFICLDADDKLAPEFVRKTMEAMAKEKKIGFVCTGSKVWNEETKIENMWIPHKIHSKYAIFAGWEGVLGCVLTRREAFDSLDHGFDATLPVYEDLDLCFRLLRKGWKLKVVSEPLHWYRIHRSSRNTAENETKKYVETLMNRRYGLIELYKKFHVFYEGVLGRATSMLLNPIEYWKGLKEKTKVNTWARSHYWANPMNREKALDFAYEISLAADKRTKWSWNKELRDYYSNRMKILEFQLQKTFSSDTMEKGF